MKLSYWNEVIKFGIDIDLLLCMLVIFECTNDNCYADSILRCEIILLSNQKELGHANWVLVENVIDYTVAAIYAMELDTAEPEEIAQDECLGNKAEKGVVKVRV